jgi:hypothetical protein
MSPVRVSASIAVALLPTASAWGQPPPGVTITGGSDESGQKYVWVVTNEHDSPIEHVEFPHYLADLFTTPPGWSAELTNPLGKAGKGGLLIADAADQAAAILPGGSAEFGLRIGPAGTPRGDGEVLIRFADGLEVRVPAEVPVQERLGNRNISLIGLAIIFGCFLLIRAWRGRRKRSRF